MEKNRKQRAVHSIDNKDIEEKVSNANYNTEDKEVLEMFAKRLNEELENQKIIQQDFCKTVTIATGTLSQYRNGIRFPQAHILLKMADVLGVSTDYLLGKSKVKKYSNIELNKMFGFTDNTIATLKAVSPKSSLNVLFDNDNEDAVNYLLEEIQNYKDDLKALDIYKKEDSDYKLKVGFMKVTKNIDFAKFRMQQALQNLVDEYYKNEIEQYNKK